MATVTASHLLNLEIKSNPYFILHDQLETLLKEQLHDCVRRKPELLKSKIKPAEDVLDSYWQKPKPVSLSEDNLIQTSWEKCLGKSHAPTSYFIHTLKPELFRDGDAVKEVLRILEPRMSSGIDNLIGLLRFSLDTGDKKNTAMSLKPISWESLERRSSIGGGITRQAQAQKNARFNFYQELPGEPKSPLLPALLLPAQLLVFLTNKRSEPAGSKAVGTAAARTAQKNDPDVEMISEEAKLKVWVIKASEPQAASLKFPYLEPVPVQVIEIPDVEPVRSSAGFGNLSVMRTDRLEESEYRWGTLPEGAAHCAQSNRNALKSIGLALGLSFKHYELSIDDKALTFPVVAPASLASTPYDPRISTSLPPALFFRTACVRFGKFGHIVYFKRFCYSQRKCDPKDPDTPPRLTPAYLETKQMKQELAFLKLNLKFGPAKKQKGLRHPDIGKTPGVELSEGKGIRPSLGSIMGDASARKAAELILGGDTAYWDAYSIWAKSGGHSAPRTALPISPPMTVRTEQEWCHLVGRAHGGLDEKENLVAGSKHCNSEQLALEHAIRVSGDSATKFSVKVTAYSRPFNIDRLTKLTPSDIKRYTAWMSQLIKNEPNKENQMIALQFLNTVVPVWIPLSSKSLKNLLKCRGLEGEKPLLAEEFAKAVATLIDADALIVRRYLLEGIKEKQKKVLLSPAAGEVEKSETSIERKIERAFDQVRSILGHHECVAIFIRYVIGITGDTGFKRVFEHIIDGQREAFNPHEYNLLHWGARFSIAAHRNPCVLGPVGLSDGSGEVATLFAGLFSNAIKDGVVRPFIFLGAGLSIPLEFTK